MGLIIERTNNTRAKKHILHRVADIPGGVTINKRLSKLKVGDTLEEGTPVGKNENGFYVVCADTEGELNVTPVGVTGTTTKIEKNDNFLVDVWVIAVVNEATAPEATEAMKTAMKGVIYV